MFSFVIIEVIILTSISAGLQSSSGPGGPCDDFSDHLSNQVKESSKEYLFSSPLRRQSTSIDEKPISGTKIKVLMHVVEPFIPRRKWRRT